MPKFLVVHKYRSDTFGPWEPGAVVELTPEQAEWVKHDSPGCLLPAHEATAVYDQPVVETPEEPTAETEVKTEEPTAETEETETEEDTEPRAADEQPQDRQIKAPPKRRKDRVGDPGDQGAMTTDDFKAVKD
jgi:hypothetical protein